MAPPPIEKEPEQRTEEFLTSKEYIKYPPGAILSHPDGREMKVSAIDFVNEGVVMQDKENNYFFYAPEDLSSFERRLQKGDYADEQFLNFKGGWVAQVIECDPEKNTLKMIKQDREPVEVEFNEFINEFIEIPDDLYAPFKYSIIKDRESGNMVYVADINLKKKKITLQNCTRIVHPPTGQALGWAGDPRTSKEVKLSDFVGKYSQWLDPVKVVHGDLPDFVEVAYTVEG